MSKTFKKLKFLLSQNGQNLVEYTVVFAGVVVIVIAALGPQGMLKDKVDRSIHVAVQGTKCMALRECFDPEGCPPVEGNGCCEEGEAGGADCAGCVDDSECDNAQFCDGKEVCILGSCLQGEPPDVSDGVDCTDDSCDEDLDLIINTPNNDFCDNGQFCDGEETCNSALGCQAGIAPEMDDDVACTDDSCDDVSGTVKNEPNDAFCSDNLACTGVETCDPIEGCKPGEPLVFDDGFDCTDDFCDEPDGTARYVPINARCNDGQFCNGTEVCDIAIGCKLGPPVDIDDGIACTDDSCDETMDEIVHTPDNSVCDDGAFCNGNEICIGGIGCANGTSPNVNDFVGCTADGCDENNDEIVHNPIDANCNDGSACNGVEWCHATEDCQPGEAPNVDDGVECTTDTCDEATGAPINTPSDAFCDDGLICTGTETCHPINDCEAGTSIDVDDGVGCTVDVCTEPQGDVTNEPDDDLCDFGFYCDADEGCKAYLCTGLIPATGEECPDDHFDLPNELEYVLVDSCTDERKCEYVCIEGYEISDDTCVAASCQAETLDVGAGQEGEFPKTNHGETGIVTCPPGFMVEAERLCEFGEWQQELIQECWPATCPAENLDIGSGLNGIFPETDHNMDGVVECPDGFDGPAIRPCWKGNWDDLTQECLPTPCERENKSIGSGQFGWFEATAHDEIGSVACPQGFAGTAQRKCEYGDWQGLLTSCTPAACAAEENVAIGSGLFADYPAEVHGQTYDPTCPASYVGTPIKECSFGEWIDALGWEECSPGPCEQANLEIGRYVNNNPIWGSFAYADNGVTRYADCPLGYETATPGEKPESTCGGGGTPTEWGPVTNKCQAKTCPAAPNTNMGVPGVNLKTNIPVGTEEGTHQPSCGAGYIGSPAWTCTDGTWVWDESATLCDFGSCPTVNNVVISTDNLVKATFNEASVGDDQTPNPQCDSTKYTGNPTRHCSAGGWDDVDDKCSPKKCSAQNNISISTDGSLKKDYVKTDSGETVTANCTSDYTGGPASRTCAFGTWSAVTNKCVPKGCAKAWLNRGSGQFAWYWADTHGDTQNPGCPADYEGTPIKKCQFGSWVNAAGWDDCGGLVGVCINNGDADDCDVGSAIKNPPNSTDSHFKWKCRGPGGDSPVCSTPKEGCTNPANGVLETSGTTKTFYSSGKVECGASCPSQSRKCLDGDWDGNDDYDTYNANSCTEEAVDGEWNGTWLDWPVELGGGWGNCDKRCGPGGQQHWATYQACDSPEPACGGDACVGQTHFVFGYGLKLSKKSRACIPAPPSCTRDCKKSSGQWLTCATAQARAITECADRCNDLADNADCEGAYNDDCTNTMFNPPNQWCDIVDYVNPWKYINYAEGTYTCTP